ncbi:MAG: histidine kinase, partial [Gammaproteobacteria bacterium]|nr:histidine kinase [Gammaproteobacteria bacterium]
MALIVYAVIVALGHVSLYLQARREQELAASQLRAELAEAQLNVMRMQLRPHFLFNALNSVGQLVRLGRVLEANDMIERLGLLLRATLKGEGRQEVAVRQELQTARAYLSIEEVRFGDRLRVVWRISA